MAGVVAVTLGGGVAALAAYRADRELSVGKVRLGVDVGHRGSLDVYVPVVDWGARFPAIRFPARLSVDVRSVDRKAVTKVAEGEEVDVGRLRKEAEDALASYLRTLIAIVLVASLGLGGMAALALRSREGMRLRWLLAAAGGTALAWTALLVVLLPPRGRIDEPEYYAHGADIPRALEAVEDATRSAGVLNEELNSQLVGLARLVVAPAGRPEPGGLPRLTLASDLHNNVLALPTLERAARDRPLVFAGDLTDQGRPLEVRLVRRVVEAGRPLLFVSGNHDSDTLVLRLAREGAIVLTERGRLEPDGGYGPLVIRFAGLRIAGYSDPFERREAQDYRLPENPRPTPEQQRRFADWLRPLVGKVDVVALHAPTLAAAAIAELRRSPPPSPLVLLVGHTHEQKVETSRNLVVLNGGTAGAGGTGNLAEGQRIGLAVLTYEREPRFEPVAADLVEVDPGDGSARAERRTLGAIPRDGGAGEP